MREVLSCQTLNDQDPNVALSAALNQQLIEAKESSENAFVAAMFRASAFLVTSEGKFEFSRNVEQPLLELNRINLIKSAKSL